MEDETCGHVSDSGSIEADTVRKPEIGHQVSTCENQMYM